MALETREVGKQTRAEARAVAEEVAIAREQVEASNRQAAAALAALDATTRPWLTAIERQAASSDASLTERRWAVFAHRPRVQMEEGRISIAVGLRNVGSGIALLQSALLRGRSLGTSELVAYPYKAFFEVPVLPPGENGWISFEWTPTQHPNTLDELVGRPGVWGELYVDVLYTDAVGSQATWALVHVTATSQEATSWAIHAIGYRRDVDEEAFARVEFKT